MESYPNAAGRFFGESEDIYEQKFTQEQLEVMSMEKKYSKDQLEHAKHQLRKDDYFFNFVALLMPLTHAFDWVHPTKLKFVKQDFERRSQQSQKDFWELFATLFLKKIDNKKEDTNKQLAELVCDCSRELAVTYYEKALAARLHNFYYEKDGKKKGLSFGLPSDSSIEREMILKKYGGKFKLSQNQKKLLIEFGSSRVTYEEKWGDGFTQEKVNNFFPEMALKSRGNPRRTCKRLEERGLIANIGESRNPKWLLTSKGWDVSLYLQAEKFVKYPETLGFPEKPK